MRSLGSLLVSAALSASPFADAAAQTSRVLLELRPRFGDTLQMRLDQSVEVAGTRKGVSAKPMVTTLSMYSRAIVEVSTPAAAFILAITDSVDVSATDERARKLVSDAERQLEGRRMRLRMAPDGTVGLADGASDAPREMNDLIALMPTSLPRGSVAIGDTWLREMRLPPSANFGMPVPGVVRAAFRLDSVAADGEEAFISVRGSIQPTKDAAAASAAYGGTVSGSMIVDRRRGWFSETRFVVQMRASVVPSQTVADTIHMRLRLTQHMMVTDKR